MFSVQPGQKRSYYCTGRSWPGSSAILASGGSINPTSLFSGTGDSIARPSADRRTAAVTTNVPARAKQPSA
jgi:hypothetical protein